MPDPAPDPLPTRASLIDQLRQPSDAGWARLEALYRPLLDYWARRAGVRGDFEDVRNEVYLRISQKIAEFQVQENRGSFRTWLRRFVLNVCREWRRKSPGPG